METQTAKNEDQSIEKMLRKYRASPSCIWLYSDLPVKKRMALAYLGADEFMEAPFEEDQVARFIEALKQVRDKTPDLFSQVRGKDHLRGEYLDSMEWELKIVALQDLGVFPHFGGFPVEWGLENVPFTAQHVNDALEHMDDYDKKTQRRLYHMAQLANKYVTALKFLPPILVEGGLLRADRDVPYEIYDWDIDDGNHRLVAASMRGATHAVCFCGTRTSQTPDNVMAMVREEPSSEEPEMVDLGDGSMESIEKAIDVLAR